MWANGFFTYDLFHSHISLGLSFSFFVKPQQRISFKFISFFFLSGREGERHTKRTSTWEAQNDWLSPHAPWLSLQLRRVTLTGTDPSTLQTSYGRALFLLRSLTLFSPIRCVEAGEQGTSVCGFKIPALWHPWDILFVRGSQTEVCINILSPLSK